MSLNVRFRFDESITLDWECAGIKPLIESISFLHELPKVCPVCQAPLHFFYRNPSDNSYYGLKCDGSPAHECNFGQHKTGDTLYYKGDGSWELEYKAREGGQQSSAPPAQPGSAAAPASALAANQPAQAPLQPIDEKAPIEKLNMIGAVARMKKVGDVEGLCKAMLDKSVSELTSSQADDFLTYLKTL